MLNKDSERIFYEKGKKWNIFIFSRNFTCFGEISNWMGILGMVLMNVNLVKLRQKTRFFLLRHKNWPPDPLSRKNRPIWVMIPLTALGSTYLGQACPLPLPFTHYSLHLLIPISCTALVGNLIYFFIARPLLGSIPNPYTFS